VPSDPAPWRGFAFPLNVFMHILTHEEGAVSGLHYGLFEREGESLAEAQERSTALLASRLPAPPARVLDVGVGLATTLHRLTAAGYDAEGITPSAEEIAVVRARYRDGVRVHRARFEEFSSGRYDVVVFQESSQYIDPEALFERAATLAPMVIVLDEFALAPVGENGGLHSRDEFLDAAARHGFELAEELDLSGQAAPTMAYFADRLPAYRERLIADVDVAPQQVDDLIESGARYRARYADGTYGYRLVRFTSASGCR
jgi:cyclopropane fatty-acyl-phospholipid synthase-like methyltransferase